MAPLDSLPADQRAVLQLVLQQGHGYDEIAAMLRIDRAAVRQRALEALDRLGPDTRLPAPRRALIADYLLGQLPPGVAEQVRERLRSSPTDRDWAAAVAPALQQIGRRPLPEIPNGSPAGSTDSRGDFGGHVAAKVGPPGDVNEPAVPASPMPSSRRGGAILLGGAAALLVAAVAVAVVLLTSGSTTPRRHHRAVTHVHQVNLYAPNGAHRPAGVAQVLRQGSAMGIVIVAAGMPANTATNAYAVWLSNSPTDNRFLGFVPTRVGSNGRLQVESKLLPSDAASFKRLLITVETTAKPTSPGQVILSGAFEVP